MSNDHDGSSYSSQPYGYSPQDPASRPQYEAPTAPRGPQPPTYYAHWGSRVGAYLIDFVVTLPGLIIFYVGRFQSSAALIAIGYLIMLLISGWNRWYRAGKTGQSLGKQVLSIRLVGDRTGQPIGPLMAFVRDLAHIIDSAICMIGYLFPLWDKKRQTIADKVCSTVVE